MTCSDSITVEKHGEITVIAVVGEVDVSTRPALERAIEGPLEGGLTSLIIDMSGATFMSSAGLRVLASTRDRLGEEAALAVVANCPATVKPIKLTDLDQLVSLCSTLDEALTSVRKHHS